MFTKLKSIVCHSTKGKVNLEQTHIIKRLKFLTLTITYLCINNDLSCIISRGGND